MSFLAPDRRRIGTPWFYADVGSTGGSTRYFAKRWRVEHVGQRKDLGLREREIAPPSPEVICFVVVGDSLTLRAWRATSA